LGSTKIVLDANVLISALLKDGRTRQLLLSNQKFEFCVPIYFRAEFLKYANHFAIKLAKPKKEILRIMKQLIELAEIKEFKKNEYVDFLSEAKNISPDPKDVPYFALALKFNCPIWTNDKLLKTQKKVKIISTHEF